MTRTPLRGAFGRLDNSPDPGDFVRYLDTVNGTPPILEHKRLSYRLLEPLEGAHVLDIGCGTGQDALELARRVGARGRVVGVDISRTMIAEARSRLHGTGHAVDFRLGDAGELDDADDTYDRCRVERTLQHLENPQHALAEIVRVTRPGGRIVAVEPDWDTLVVDAPDLALSRRIVASATDHHRCGTIGRELRRRFHDLGLDRVTVQAHTIVFTDFPTAVSSLQLPASAEHALAAGAGTPDEISDWLAGLEEAGRAGRFFCALTTFLVTGGKPVVS
jgi:SAM-dependent methyltransferase